MHTLRARSLLLAVGLALAAFVIWRADPRLVYRMLADVGPRAFVVVGIYTVHLCVRAAALWRAVPGGGIRYRDVLRVRMSGEAIEMLTMTGPFLAEPTKGLLLKRRGLDSADAFAAVAIEYSMYTVVSAALTVFAFSALLSRGVIPTAVQPAAALVLVVSLAVLATYLFVTVRGFGAIMPLVRASRVLVGADRAERFASKAAPVEDKVVAFLHDRPAQHIVVLALEVAAHSLLVIEVAVVVALLGHSLSWRDCVVVEGGVKFISVAFAFVPGQLGAAEGVYGLLFGFLGLPAAIGLTLMLLRRFRDFVVALAGLVSLAAG